MTGAGEQVTDDWCRRAGDTRLPALCCHLLCLSPHWSEYCPVREGRGVVVVVVVVVVGLLKTEFLLKKSLLLLL